MCQKEKSMNIKTQVENSWVDLLNVQLKINELEFDLKFLLSSFKYDEYNAMHTNTIEIYGIL